MPSLLILVPLFGIIILNLPFGNLMRRLAFWFALAICIIQIALAVTHYPLFWGSELQKLDSFFKIDFSLDHLSFVMLLCIGIVIRTVLEDKTLLAELPGYKDYAEKVRFRLIPGVW